MTSPYLEKPRRELGQALKDCGISRSDVGVQPENVKFHSAQSNLSSAKSFAHHQRRGTRMLAVLAVGLLIVSATVIVATTSPEQQVAHEEPNPDDVINIAPAAGGPH